MFSIIVFKAENTIEGVPSSWVLNDNGKDRCYWPKSAKVSVYIKNLQDPLPDWPLYDCIVKSTAATLVDMKRKVQALQYCSTTELDSDEEIVVNHDQGSSEDDLEIEAPPNKRYKLSDEGVNWQRMFEMMSNLTNKVNNLEMSTNAIKIKMAKNYEKLTSAMVMYQEQCAKMAEDIKLLSNKSVTTALAGEVATNLEFPSLPVGSLEDLQVLEERVQAQENAVALIGLLKTYGATSSLNSTIHHMMKYLMKAEVAVLHTLHGKNGKIPFLPLTICTCVRGE